MFKFLKINERRLSTTHSKLDNEDTYLNTLTINLYVIIKYTQASVHKCVKIFPIENNEE